MDISKVFKFFKWKKKWNLWLYISIFVLVCLGILYLCFSKDDDTVSIIVPETPISAETPPKRFGKNETRCREIVEKLFNKPFPNIRPSFMKNPETGRNLELDMYNEEINLVIEYQGVQHRLFTPRFHKSILDFEKQQKRDLMKKNRLLELKIDFIEIPDTVKYENLEEYIIAEVNKIPRLKHYLV